MNMTSARQIYFFLVIFFKYCHKSNNKSGVECTYNQSWTLLSECNIVQSKRRETKLVSTLRFNSSMCLLSTVIVIEDKDLVLVTGMPTEIKCYNVTNAGLHIRRVSNLVVKDLTLSGCGVDHDITTNNSILYYFRSAMYIVNCTNVTLQAIEILGSCGTGLVMLDNDGLVLINASRFEKNSLLKAKENAILSGGSGLHIELSYCGIKPRSKRYISYCNDKNITTLSGSKYYITQSYFSGNTNSNLNSKLEYAYFYTGFGAGGGMALLVGGSSKDNQFIIEDCKFSNNNAALGGGLYIAVQDKSTINEIVVKKSTFQENNSSFSTGLGGGVSAGYLFNLDHKWNNSIKFISCKFLENRALYGGGGSFYFSKSMLANNTIELSRCNWTKNSATFGAAIKISPHLWGSDSAYTHMTLTMKGNKVSSNYLFASTNKGIGRGKATVLVEKGKIRFSDENVFDNNNGSALCLDSSEAEFTANSHIKFIDNRGFQGGAIAMTGYSIIRFSDNSTFWFINNSAQDGGGALFQLGSSWNVQASRTCFIQYNGDKENIEDYNTSFMFINNSGTLSGRENTQISWFGHSILTTSIKPCQKSSKECRIKGKNDLFDCIGDFIFFDKINRDLSTFENNVTTRKKKISAMPGKLIDLNLTTTDEFSNEVAAIYHVSIINTDSASSPVTTDSKFTYVSNSKVRLYGNPGQKVTLHLESTTIHHIALEIEVDIVDCPPGYIFQQEDEQRKKICVCSSETNSSYSGISFCSRTEFHAYLLHGHWMGYKTDKIYAKEKDLIFSSCFFGRCLVNKSAYIKLPDNTNVAELNSCVCGDNRTGIFCSKCQSNYFMNYHSRTFTCSPSPNRCQLGWLYYILSELVPVTVFFVAVTAFDIRLTSGSINGYLLFMQLSDSLQIQGNGFIKFSNVTIGALKVYFLFIGIFNMDYFKAEELSYCLWETATTLDLLALKYLTITYALGLVFTTILVLKYCNMTCFRTIRRKLLKKSKSVPITRMFIHGLSGFLIICYSEATKTSLLLLTPARLYSFGSGSGLQVNSTVAASDGDLLFFQGKHLVYALPALLVLGVLGLAPPVLLFIYPLCYKLFGLMRISESRFIKALCIVIPLDKCKPFFDSFQSGFKDSCRFFAGLYFLYRLTTLVSFVVVGQSLTFHILVAVQFLVMIAFHAIFQPLRNPRHNIEDALLFANLLLINLLTIMNTYVTFYFTKKPSYIDVTTSIQVLLLYMPLVYAAVCIGKKILRRTNLTVLMKKKDKDLMNYKNFSAILDAVDRRCLQNTSV